MLEVRILFLNVYQYDVYVKIVYVIYVYRTETHNDTLYVCVWIMSKRPCCDLTYDILIRRDCVYDARESFRHLD